MSKNYKQQHTFSERQMEASRILVKYPDRIPVIVEKVPGSIIEDIDRKKYLVPGDITVGQFMYVIRKRIKLSPEQAIFIFMGENMPATSSLMSKIYNSHKEEDQFLYLSYASENTFGK
tara:strand:+ start:346 stop:699 length:354 start_codon:yes stop_codon:yes gene_type:complete